MVRLLWMAVGWPGLIVLGSVVATSAGLFPPADLPLDLAALGIALIGLLLALFLAQGRALLALLWLGISYLALVAPSDSLGTDLDPGLVAGVAALNIAVLAVLPPARPLGRRGLIRLVVTLAQMGAVVALGASPAGWNAISARFAAAVGPLTASATVIGAASIGLIVLVVGAGRSPRAVHRAAVWTNGALVLATVGPAWASVLLAAGVGWVAAIIESTYVLSYRDGLTRLPSRRAFDMALTDLGRRYSVAMVDVDHFKQFNDRHGHDIGDQVLKMVARQLGRVRGGRAYRYGGEEFAIIFPRRAKDGVKEILKELLGTIERSEFHVRGGTSRARKGTKRRRGGGGGKRVSVTVSIGAAERSGLRRRSADVVEAADKALYRAKRAGRNCVRWAPR